mgnify:CR=1 FL=1
MAHAEIRLNELVESRVERLVAVEVEKHGKATLFLRSAGGILERRKVEFRPWLLVGDNRLADELSGVHHVTRLEPPGRYKLRVHLEDLDAYFGALKTLRATTGRNMSDPRAPYRVFNDPQQQFLSLFPARLFRGMRFDDLRRLQLDIETWTAPGFDFPNPDREEDEIIMVALRDNTGWERCLSGPEFSEKEILAELVRCIAERDPDVVEGHNIFNFDLPYIEARCKLHNVPFRLGRDGRFARRRVSRFTAAERSSTYQRYDLYGRHVVDTLHLTRLYDAVHRALESHSLKAVAEYFGVAAPQRTHIAGAEIAAEYKKDVERLRRYSLDDAYETDALSRVLSPSYFHQAQMVPFSYQNCVTRGNAARIDALLVALYMRADRSIPEAESGRPFRGGLTASIEEGVFRHVWHVDIRSLYPSVILTRGLCPRRDILGVFPNLLKELRAFRLAAKDAARRAATAGERDHYDALQSSFKILINSFYGYVGFSRGTFNDYDMAERVTAHGRQILESMLDFLRGRGATVIEMDTDGVYFVPPPDIVDPEVMETMVQEILPEGIEVELDAVYRAMLGYKAKNYALLNDSGRVEITGAALKSRGLEPFQRRYISEVVTLLLQERVEEIEALYERYSEAISRHEFPLSDFAKRENLSTPPRVYREKLEAGKTRRSAAYELALAAKREYQQGDQVAYYVTGNAKKVTVTEAAKLLSDAVPGERDENVPYYQDKLKKLHRKFAPFVERLKQGETETS